MITGSMIDGWRRANPTQDYCDACGTFTNVGHVPQPGLGSAKYCFICINVLPESHNPQYRMILKLFSILLNELKPPKKPRTPRQNRGKLTVMPMAPRRR